MPHVNILLLVLLSTAVLSVDHDQNPHLEQTPDPHDPVQPATVTQPPPIATPSESGKGNPKPRDPREDDMHLTVPPEMTPHTGKATPQPDPPTQPKTVIINTQTHQGEPSTASLTQQDLRKTLREMMKNMKQMSEQDAQKIEEMFKQSSRESYQIYKEEREAFQRQQQEQIAKLEPEIAASLQQSQLTLRDESRQYGKLMKEKGPISGQEQYSFYMEREEITDFKLSIPADQPIKLELQGYEESEGVYSKVKPTAEMQPVRVSIYQETHRLVYDSNFYNKKYIVLDGKGNTTYLLRFSNLADKRLVIMKVSKLIEEHHFKERVTVEDVADHPTRLKQINEDFFTKMEDVQTKLALEMQNHRKLQSRFDQYYVSIVGELVFLGILVVMQVECVKRLLLTTTVI